eukprot:Transcript_16382.p3 GENE.Transcript_16382~~Transcript_16382.p3  ORF type:complete len:183 (-),score=60.18 Transcript_16382:135-683(-)
MASLASTASAASPAGPATAAAEGEDEWTVVTHRGRAPRPSGRVQPGAAPEARAEPLAFIALAEAAGGAAPPAPATAVTADRDAATTASDDDASAEPDGAAAGGAWAGFLARHPEADALNLQLRHVLGEGVDELSMAQLGTLHELHRLLQQRLEEARLLLARRLEREAVEARLAIEIEKRLRQ